jgi:hydrogenase expression/formation protein HypC
MNRLYLEPAVRPNSVGQHPLSEGRIMCLGIPGKVLETYHEDDVLMGNVDFGGIQKRVCLEHVPEARTSDYVLVHVGFALSLIDEAEAKRVFAFLEHMNQLDELESRAP